MKVKELVELLLTFDQEIDVVNEDLFYIDSAHIENGNKVLQYRQEDLEEFENSWNNLSDEYKQQLINIMGFSNEK